MRLGLVSKAHLLIIFLSSEKFLSMTLSGIETALLVVLGLLPSRIMDLIWFLRVRKGRITQVMVCRLPNFNQSICSMTNDAIKHCIKAHIGVYLLIHLLIWH